METKCRLKNMLLRVRKMSEGFLKDFHTPEDWLYQVDPTSNHALWFAGHMGLADNFFIGMVSPENASQPPRYNQMFGMGSKPSSDPALNPPIEEVVEYMRERRTMLHQLLDGMTDEDLLKPTAPGTPEMWPDLISLVETTIWHEGMHAGQVSVARKALGFKPIVTRTPADAVA